jgi:predicted signal transduction protein with EAL and GGDEF domain
MSGCGSHAYGKVLTLPLRAADSSPVVLANAAPRRHVLGTAGIAVGWTLWYLFWLVKPDLAGPVAIAYTALPIGAAVAAHGILVMIRRVRLDHVAMRFWRLMLIAMILFCAGFAMMAVEAFRVAPELPTFPIPAAALVGAGFLGAMWAVGRVPLGITGRGERGRQWLDRSIAFLGCGTVLFQFALAPMINASDGWSVQTLTLIGLSLSLALGGITKVSYIGDGPVDRVALRLIGATGLVGAGVALLAIAGGVQSSVPAQAILMPLAPMSVAIAVRRQWFSTGARPRRANTWLPYLALVAVDAPLLATLHGGLTWSDRLVVVNVMVVTGLVAVRQYVTIRENGRLLRDKRATELRLRHEVTHDGLTGLANRGLFRDRLASVLASGAGGATVLLVDLDDFKTVNDSLGHDVGDQLLIAVAEALRSAVGDAGLPVRLGGDEFAVMLTADTGSSLAGSSAAGSLVAGSSMAGSSMAGSPAAGSLAAASPVAGSPAAGEAVAERILAAFAGPMSAHDLLVRASIGIADAPSGTPLDQLLRDADAAMYAAKQRGKANWVRYHHGMEQPVLAHARLGGELRRALDADEFRVVYQPIIDLQGSSRRVIGVEALVRWEHPVRGTVAPAGFIPAAEGTGLIVPLGRFVLREACRQAAAWLAAYGPDALQKVGANVSIRQLHDPDFVADVRAVLAETGLPADRLVLEVTESAVLRGPQVSRTLQELYDMGVRLALDDFGTGESSLSLLRAFPASIIKLDKSFVDGIELDEPGTPAADARQAVARAVVQLAGALGLDTVAEGIENEEQAVRLRALGYSLGQGYHLARPMSAADLSERFARQLIQTGA